MKRYIAHTYTTPIYNPTYTSGELSDDPVRVNHTHTCSEMQAYTLIPAPSARMFLSIYTSNKNTCDLKAQRRKATLMDFLFCRASLSLAHTHTSQSLHPLCIIISLSLGNRLPPNHAQPLRRSTILFVSFAGHSAPSYQPTTAKIGPTL